MTLNRNLSPVLDYMPHTSLLAWSFLFSLPCTPFCDLYPSNWTGHLSLVDQRECYLPSNPTLRPSCSSTARAGVVTCAVALVGACPTNIGLVLPTLPHSRCLKTTTGKSNVGQGRIEAIQRQCSYQSFSQYTTQACIKGLSLFNSFATALAKKHRVIASDGCKTIARLTRICQRIKLID